MPNDGISIQVGEEYLEEVTELNPDIEDNQYVRELRGEIVDAKARLRTSMKG